MDSYASPVNVSGHPREDKRTLEQPEKTTKLVDGRYELGLSFVEDNATIQNISFSAPSQFCSLERRLEKHESLKQRYEETINVDLHNGYNRKLEEEN